MTKTSLNFFFAVVTGFFYIIFAAIIKTIKIMGAIKYPFGSLPVVTQPEASANTYAYTVDSNCVLNLKGTALGAAAAITLTAATNLNPGTIVLIQWLSDTSARAVTVKPLFHANGQSFAGTASKRTSVSVMYDGTNWIPISHVQSIEVS